MSRGRESAFDENEEKRLQKGRARKAGEET
jgi:hypothetical protein